MQERLRASLRAVPQRLALMMFLHYFVLGAFVPILSLYLKDYLHFTGAQIGIIQAMSPIATLISPFFIACIADRFFSARALLGLCHVAAAGLIVLLRFQDQWGWFLLIYLAYVLLLAPAVPLTNAITFHHRSDANRKFGHTRVWGTIGWAAAAWVFGAVWLSGNGAAAATERLPDALLLSSIASVILSIYSITLPSLPKKKRASLPRLSEIIPFKSLRLFANSQILLLAGVGLGMTAVDKMYYLGAAPYLRYWGYSDRLLMPIMSLGQVSEVVAMILLVAVIAKVGVKTTLLIGITAEILRFATFAVGGTWPCVILAMIGHGVAFAMFFVTVFMAIDSFSDEDSRTALHQLFAIITAGAGGLLANLLGGICLDLFIIQPTDYPDYRTFWLIPMGISILSFLLVWTVFDPKKEG